MNRETKPVRALIFSASIGAGHDSVARALTESLAEVRPGSEVKTVDTFNYINRVLHKAVFGSYMETLKFTPKVWGYLYEQAEEGERLVDLGQILSKLFSPKLVRLLNEFKPDVIVSTHAFPTGILSVLKERIGVQIPMAAVVTDFHVHTYWIHHGIDRYFIPAPDLAYHLLEDGIAAEKIKGTGIPIRAQFSSVVDPEAVRRELGLNSHPSVLVMGGGLGLGRIELIVKELLNNSMFEVVVVAGKNQRLVDKLAGLKNARLHTFGFVENMARVVAACDLVISKPGGVTTAEVLALRKPLIIYSPLPGQEDRNTDYLLNKGAAIKVRKLDMLIPEIMSFWNDPLRRRHVREMAEKLSTAHAARLVWDELLSLLGAADVWEVLP